MGVVGWCVDGSVVLPGAAVSIEVAEGGLYSSTRIGRVR